MNIDVYGRVRPSIRGEGPQTLLADRTNRVTIPGGGTLTLSGLYHGESSNYDVFRGAVTPLVDLFHAGLNTCLFVTGESGSGKSFTVSGEHNHKSGIVTMIIEDLFRHIDDGYSTYNNHLHNNTVNLQMYEIYNELVKDLLVVPNTHTDYLDVDENSEKGPYVKRLSSASVVSAEDGAAIFKQGFARRTQTETDFGPAKNHATIIINIDLSLKTVDSPATLPNKSRFTIVVSPGIEKLTENAGTIRMHEGPSLSKSLIATNQLVSELSGQPFADRVINYSASRLTHLLQNEIGGNCKTRVLLCFRPQSDPTYLRSAIGFASQFAKVRNYPVVNDHLTQELLTQYRSKIINLKQQLSNGDVGTYNVHDGSEQTRRLQTDNLQLRDKNERLHMYLNQLQGKFGHLATSKTDLSSQLLLTEEEKLKVSKTLVEMQIENNKLAEEMETVKFELTNKILHIEDTLVKTEVDKDKHAKAAKSYKTSLEELQKDRKTLAEEYITLKSNFMNVSAAHEREVAKNEELSVELLNLVNTKAALLRELDGHHSPSAEVERIRNIISQRPPQLSYDRTKEDTLRKTLLGSHTKYEGELERMKHEYNDAEKMLGEKMTSKNQQIMQLRNHLREKQKKIAEMNAQLITLRNTSESVNLMNNRIQNKLKDVNDEFKSRLVKYVEDIARFVDKEHGKQDGTHFRKYVDEMMKDLRKAYKIREEQLSTAVQHSKKRISSIVRKHEELLVAYRELREQVEERGLDEIDLGPDEIKLHLTDRELLSKQEKEILRLKEGFAQYQNELESMKIRARVDDKAGFPNAFTTTGDNWTKLRKQIYDFTATTQQQLEVERAELLSKNAILDQQVHDLQNYIDDHLVRYRDEIQRLRQQLSSQDDVRFKSPPPRARLY